MRRLLPLIISLISLALLPGMASASTKVATSTETATLLVSHVVRPYPGGGPAIRTLPAQTPLTHVATTTPVVGTAYARGVKWVRVELPGRPNGSLGWISTNGVRLERTSYQFVVDRAARQATLYHHGKVERRFSVVVGKPSTPTPAGHFYVEEVLNVGPGVAGPYVLATSARSNVLQDFDGGPGQIGLHGRNGLPDPIGTASSHGCVRFLDQDITWIVQHAHIGPGTPITIQ